MNDRNRFDKFTERARSVLHHAQTEPQRFGHNYIGTEHLLLGLLLEGEGVAATVLRNLNVDTASVRSKVEAIIGTGNKGPENMLGLTPRSKKVIELAVDEARRLNHHYIGTEHLLLGLVREGEGIAAGVLRELGVNLDKVRRQTVHILLQQSPVSDPLPDDPPQQVSQEEGTNYPLPKKPTNPRTDVTVQTKSTRTYNGYPFTEQAYTILERAREEALRLSHNYIGTEHLLLGMVLADLGVAGAVLHNLGVTAHRTRSAVEFIIGRGDRVVIGEIALTPRSKKILNLASEEAQHMNNPYLGTEHLLLALIEEGEGIGAGVLNSMGVYLQHVRAETTRVLQHATYEK